MSFSELHEVFAYVQYCNIILYQDELPEELIEKVKYKVNRDSPEDKTRDYLDWMKAVKKEMFHIVRTYVCMVLHLVELVR